MRKSRKTGVLRRQTAVVTTLLLSTAFTGCASLGVGHPDFSCPEREHGVACHSVREVYKHTEDRDQLSNNDFGESDEKQDNNDDSDRHNVAQRPPRPHAPTVPAADGPIPLRTPSRVMRIRLNYWESEDGNLHVPGYVYTEIEPRRWRVGLQEPGNAKVLHPLRTVQPPRAGSTPADRSHGEPRRKNGKSMSAYEAAKQTSG